MSTVGCPLPKTNVPMTNVGGEVTVRNDKESIRSPDSALADVPRIAAKPRSPCGKTVLSLQPGPQAR
jgi:hypothetical protein